MQSVIRQPIACAPFRVDVVSRAIEALAFSYWFLWMTREITGVVFFGASENYPFSQALGLIFALVAIALQSLRGPVSVNWPSCGKWIFLYFAWAGISLLWTTAESPGAVLLNWLEFGGDLLFICLAMSSGSDREIVFFSSLRAIVIGGCCLGIYTVATFRPGIDMRDISALHPNFLGHRIALASLSALFIWSRQRRRRIWLGISLLLILSLLLTTSKTAIGAFLMVSGIFVALHPRLKGRTKFWISTTLGVAIAAALPLVLFNFVQYADSSGPSELSGRLPLWIVVFAKTMERPLLGFGYGSFADNWPLNMWFTGNAHNEFLQEWFTLGAVGIFVILMIYFKLFRALRRAKTETARFGILLLSYCLMRGMLEADDTHLLFALLFACALPRIARRCPKRIVAARSLLRLAPISPGANEAL